MKGLYVVLLAGLALVAPSGCTRPCREGTVFLRLRYAAGLNADYIQVTVRQLDTSFVAMREFAPSSSEDSLEIGFPGGAYPRDALLVIDVAAERSGLRVGGGQGQAVLGPGCTSFTVTVVPDSNPASPISHVPEHYLTDGTCDLTITTTTSTFNTGTGQFEGEPVGLPAGCIYGAESIPGNDGGPPSIIAVLAVRSLTISSTGVLKVTGPNPLVIAAANTIQVDGTIDGSANFHAAGPGGLRTGPGVGGNGGNSELVDSGGAGGSFGTLGADGADARGSTVSITGGARGNTYNDDTFSRVLQAGSAGGNGAGPVTDTDPFIACGLGGGGGGAIQLTAKTSLQIGATGRILVNGGGGLGGCGDNSTNDARSGGGGGSGGALFLEAPTVSIDNGAVLTANGGGGGSGADPVTGTAPGIRGQDGQNGSASNTPALGGTTVGGGSGTGGSGATSGTIATSGTVTGNTGGGGAGLGRIVLRAHNQPTTQATISPAATFVAF